MPLTTAVAIHVASATPNATNADQRPSMNGAPTPTTSATTAGTFSCFIRPLIFADFQLATGPTAMSTSAVTISGMKTALKYGGPTESLPNPSASMKSGYNVPRITAPAATANNTLFSSNRDSRDISSNRPPMPTLGARSANKSNDEPTTTANNIKMNTPRRGRSEEHTSELQSLMRISYAVFCWKK